MSWTKIRSIIVIFFSSLIGILVFLITDFFYGHYHSGVDLREEDKPYLKLENGWYELKRNFLGKDQFGPLVYPVATDKYGFRKSERTDNQGKYDVIFLGDSFTYGINGSWDKTFVGMFAKLSGQRVLNAGVSSYSPTAYLYQYKKASANNLLVKDHIVVIGIDVSDVQDEAAFWTWDEDKEIHPRKIETKFSVQEIKNNRPNLREKFRNSFPMSATLYRFIRYRFFLSHVNQTKLDLINMPRSAFTWESWQKLDKTYPQESPSGYAPLGVERGLSKISDRVLKISGEAKKNNGTVYLLIYPWPAQIVHIDRFNWSAWINNLCIKANCEGVIDTFPYFLKMSKEESNWLSKYYLQGDIHFNEIGNRVIAEHIFKNISVKNGANP
jgi:hypothetical protein